ncbi:MAG: hypothetical protein GX170_05820 [Campylobacteraceae bacterium]|nr:hypothetical protein [Campylobacteraceae bacterium]
MEQEVSKNETKKVLDEIVENNIKTFIYRVNLSSITKKRLDAMFPIYFEESNATTQKQRNEQVSALISKAIDYMFENDFRKKIEDL